MNSLVGFTGFVGSNIIAKGTFEGLYNSKNIETAYGTSPELLVYAGLPAEKFIANKAPKEDKHKIQGAIDNIKKINPKKLILISTIDVYPYPNHVDEDSFIDKTMLLPYGFNRLYLEEFVERNFQDYMIVRLPGLFGKNIKKNFIYDFIHFIPTLLKEIKYQELSSKSDLIKSLYQNQHNGFYKCIATSEARNVLRREFETIGFSALKFTDSRGKFQFYDLSNLWRDITIALQHNIKKINMATEPIRISELYSFLMNKPFINEFLQDNIPNYDFRSKYALVFGGRGGYLYDKIIIMKRIKDFVEAEKNEISNFKYCMDKGQ